MLINQHEINFDNVQNWSDKDLEQAKKYLSNSFLYKEQRLCDLIDLELARRKTISATNQLFEIGRLLLMRDTD